MAVGGGYCEPVSGAIPCLTGKEQGILVIQAVAETDQAEIPEQIRKVATEFPTHANREFFRANRECQEQNRESTLPDLDSHGNLGGECGGVAVATAALQNVLRLSTAHSERAGRSGRD